MSLEEQGDLERGAVSTPSCCELFRWIGSMIASKSEFDTEVEDPTEHSKVHWSELTSEYDDGLDIVESVGDQVRDFVWLQNDEHWGPFCSKVQDVVLGEKLGEGAQGFIYEAQVSFVHWRKAKRRVVKVMKGNSGLAELQKQWPPGLVYLSYGDHLHGALVKDPITQSHQFGFVMERSWGDLRTLIDLRLEHKSKSNSSDPPFTITQAKRYMGMIGQWMLALHSRGIIHRDLKATNVLLFPSTAPNKDVISDKYVMGGRVADFECSVGVVGTGFWRAPEILEQLKNRVRSAKLEFTKKVDVYGYAMTCYEILTGRIPFADLPFDETRDAIINGARPELPHDLDPKIRELITSCWHPNPSLRPNFRDLGPYFGKSYSLPFMHKRFRGTEVN